MVQNDTQWGNNIVINYYDNKIALKKPSIITNTQWGNNLAINIYGAFYRGDKQLINKIVEVINYSICGHGVHGSAASYNAKNKWNLTINNNNLIATSIEYPEILSLNPITAKILYGD